MSSDSLAAFRKTVGNEFADLANDHFQHDLEESDRTTLKSAASTLSLYTTVGSLLGLGLSTFLALRLRTARRQMFNTFLARDKPTHIKFANGREEAIPDITPLLQPSLLGDLVTYSLFGFGGVFVGGEMGLLLGSGAAGRTVRRDEESYKRIETAFRSFRVDVLKKEAEMLEKGNLPPFGRYW